MAVRHQNWQHVVGTKRKLNEGKAAMKNLCWPHDERIKNVANLWPKCSPHTRSWSDAVRSINNGFIGPKASVGRFGWLAGLSPSEVVRFWQPGPRCEYFMWHYFDTINLLVVDSAKFCLLPHFVLRFLQFASLRFSQISAFLQLESCFSDCD